MNCHSETVLTPMPAALAQTDAAGAILALDLGTRTGWAIRTGDGVITSGVSEFRPGRFQGGGMAFLRFPAWRSCGSATGSTSCSALPA
jgi:hypothetical protein